MSQLLYVEIGYYGQMIRGGTRAAINAHMAKHL
jgi:hypothetical protein